jgi:hypothetical protein
MKGPAGEVNSTTRQLDVDIRCPQRDSRNAPNRGVFEDFVAMGVTWK